MASTVNQQQSFPAVPPLQSASDYRLQDNYVGEDVSRPTIYQTPYLKPYLGLRARLSQIWINRWSVLLILVLVRLLFAIASTNSSLASARREALSACTQVENIGSSMASMPHYMSQGINELTASGAEKAVNGLMSMLDLSVTGVEEIAIFLIHALTDTYLCLLTLAVNGGVDVFIKVTNETTNGLDKLLDEIADPISDAVGTITDAIGKMNSVLANSPALPDIGKPLDDIRAKVNALKTFDISDKVQQPLNDVKQAVPSFEEVRNFTDNLIRLPFEEVKKLIALKDNWQFDRQLLPVPAKEQLNFCSEGNSINDFFDDLVVMGYTAKKIALAVLIVAAILVCIPMAYSEVRRFRKMEQRSQLFHQGHEPMDVVYLASRPHSGTYGMWLGNRFGTGHRQSAVRWAFAYATSFPMLFLLSLGIAGLFSCFCQYLLVKGIEKKVPGLTDQVADFAEKVVTSLNNASMSWSGGVNGALEKLDNEINDEILGWVNTTTGAINNTLNEFTVKTDELLTKAFGGTPFKEPIQEVIKCLIGLKIAGFQKALTWVSDHAHVSFPTVKNDTFSLGALAHVSNSSSAAELLANPNDKAKDEVTEAVDHVIDTLISGIRTEALISTVLIALWLIAALGGIIYACIYIARQPRALPAGIAYNENPIARPAAADLEKNQEYPDTAAPPYEYQTPVNKAAPQPLQPRSFQTFGPINTDPESEKIGQVGAHAVAESARPGHLRASSYGHLADPSPSDEKKNPFLSREEHRYNPFTG
jgi:hypothetical protein